LFSPEKCGYGAGVFGRAFDPSQILGDSCALVLGELRYDIPTGSRTSPCSSCMVFADFGWLHNIAPLAGTRADVDAASAGEGFASPAVAVFDFWFMSADLSAAKASRVARRLAFLFIEPDVTRRGHARASIRCFWPAPALLLLGSFPARRPDEPRCVGGQATVTGAGSARSRSTRHQQRHHQLNTFNIGPARAPRRATRDLLSRSTASPAALALGNLRHAHRQWPHFPDQSDGRCWSRLRRHQHGRLLATTSDIRNQDFMAGRYVSASRAIQCSIVKRRPDHGDERRFCGAGGAGVRNTGTITATLAPSRSRPGNTFTLDLYGDKLIQLAPGDEIASKVIDVATKQPLKDLVSNSGKLSANGGRGGTHCRQARIVVDSVINNTGVIEANSIGSRNGKIVLVPQPHHQVRGAPVQT